MDIVIEHTTYTVTGNGGFGLERSEVIQYMLIWSKQSNSNYFTFEILSKSECELYDTNQSLQLSNASRLDNKWIDKEQTVAFNRVTKMK